MWKKMKKLSIAPLPSSLQNKKNVFKPYWKRCHRFTRILSRKELRFWSGTFVLGPAGGERSTLGAFCRSTHSRTEKVEKLMVEDVRLKKQLARIILAWLREAKDGCWRRRKNNNAWNILVDFRTFVMKTGMMYYIKMEPGFIIINQNSSNSPCNEKKEAYHHPRSVRCHSRLENSLSLRRNRFNWLQLHNLYDNAP